MNFFIDPVPDAIAYVKRGLNLSRKLKEVLDKRGQAILTLGHKPHQRLYQFYDQMIDAFNKNTIFLLDVIEWRGTDIEPLRAILRILIDLYARAIFLLSLNKDERLKRIIGDSLWLSKDKVGEYPLDKVYREIAKEKNWSLPTDEEIKKDKKIRNEFMENWTFERISTKKMITKFHKEDQPPIEKKGILVGMYNYYSDQLHGNVFINMEEKNINPVYQILYFTMVLNSHYLRKVFELAEEDVTLFDSYVMTGLQNGTFDHLQVQWRLDRAQRGLKNPL